ncbi:hypothetical protein F5051DRAFT_414796 [Lentinula edodes]|nr:hypothetical protein F5051DRAFT_414796 [Lentinula edodes]
MFRCPNSSNSIISRPTSQPDSRLEPLILDINTIALAHPQFLAIGGNTGQVNTFTGVDVEVLTGGVYNAATLL